MTPTINQKFNIWLWRLKNKKVCTRWTNGQERPDCLLSDEVADKEWLKSCSCSAHRLEQLPRLDNERFLGEYLGAKGPSAGSRPVNSLTIHRALPLGQGCVRRGYCRYIFDNLIKFLTFLWPVIEAGTQYIDHVLFATSRFKGKLNGTSRRPLIKSFLAQRLPYCRTRDDDSLLKYTNWSIKKVNWIHFSSLPCYIYID